MDIRPLRSRILAAMGIPALVLGCNTVSPEEGGKLAGPGPVDDVPADPGPQPPDPVVEEPAEPPPPEPEPFLVSLSTLEVHRITTVTVTGALPNADLVVAWSLSPGESCPPQFEGGCLDLALDGPQLVGVPTTTDENGQVTFQARVPEGWWVGDGTPLLVQAAALTADGTYASSEVLETAFEVTPRNCGWVEELNPNLTPEELPDQSGWLVCAPPLDDGSCEQLDPFTDPWRPIELFSEVLGEPLPPQWSVMPACVEEAFGECCWTMFADDLSQGANGGFYGYLGRPFVVEETARTAKTRGAPGWTEALPLSVAGMDEALRETVASRWAAIGAAEHASIASFARFHLELLALGAPASLLEAASGALRDEIAHARLAYSVASAYAGRPMGPGSLPIDHALDRSSDPAHVLVAAILEGCIGETLSAAQVQREASLVADLVLAEALAKVAEDEARHAELSWAFVRWLLQARPDLRPLAAATFDRWTLPERPEAGDLAQERVFARYGLSSARAQHDVAERVLREVIRPCADALLDREAAA